MNAEDSRNAQENAIETKSNGANGTSANGSEQQQQSFDEYQRQLLRLVAQTLTDFGLSESARVLEHESGVQLQTSEVAEFCALVLDGQWSKAADCVDKLILAEGHDAAEILFHIYRQQYLELLDDGKVAEALKCLHEQISPLRAISSNALQDSSLQELSSFMLCKSGEELRSRLDTQHKQVRDMRRDVLEEVRKFISPAAMLPHGRLQTLIDQALEFQRSRCLYHNVSDYPVSLYENHTCTRYEIPCETAQILDAHTDQVWHVQFSHNGRWLASASKDRSVWLWRVNDDGSVKKVRRLVGHKDAVSFVCWSPDDRKLLTCSSDNTIGVWNVDTGRMEKSVQSHHDGPSLSSCVGACAWLPDGKQFISGGLDKKAILNNIDGTTQWVIPTGVVQDLAVSNDGKLLIIACQEKKLWLYDLQQCPDCEPTVLQETDVITSITLSDNAQWLLVNMPDGVHMWDLKLRRLEQIFRGQKQSRFVIRSAFGGSHEGFVASGSEDSQVYVWNRQSSTLLEVLEGHSGVVNGVAWNPVNLRMLASASDDGTVRIWSEKKKKARSPSQQSNGDVKSPL